MTATHNTHWIALVRIKLAAGYGVEDIALHMKSRVDDVRREVAILREQGDLARMFPATK